jgi:hypothetical protein
MSAIYSPPMPLISVTHLRIRSLRFLPAFRFHAMRANSQLRGAVGFNAGAFLPERHRTFWTLSCWERAEDMRAYMKTGPHRTAMPKLMEWCDEASVVNWEQDGPTLPDWFEADRRMRLEGRPSKVRHPTPDHLGMTFAPPRELRGAAVSPRPR